MDTTSKSQFAAPWVQFCEEFGEIPLLYGPVESIHAGYAKLLSAIVARCDISPTDESVQTEDVQVNSDFKVRVYHPPGATRNETLGIYIHGGGWTICDVDSEDAICRLISKTTNMVLVSVDYRLGPKYKFPAALDDCVEATKWAVANASKIGAKNTNIVLMGGSAGGNLAIGSALKLIDQGQEALISGIIALVPVTIHPDAVPASIKHKHTAYEENANNTLNTKSAMLEFWNCYGAPMDDIYTSCLLHPRLKNLPKTYLTECGMDTLRDDARLFRDALKDADVDVKYDSYPGYPHWSWTFPSPVLSEHSGEVFGNLFEAIKWILA